MAARDFEVVVGGGGMVGAAVAALLVTDPGARGLRVALVETDPATMPLPGDPAELRVSALSRASERLLRTVGAFDLLAVRPPCPYSRMRVWDAASEPDGAQALVFDAADLGEPNLGLITENRAIAAALLTVALRGGATLLRAPLTAFEPDADAVRVTVGDRGLQAGVVVAADGARSMLRGLAGIAVRVHPYPQRAVVARLLCERPHAGEARQRFLPDGPLALLPLSDGAVSLVWSTTPEHADELLAMDDGAFALAVTEASGHVLGELHAGSHRQAFPLSRDHAATYAGPRLALVGDAAHTVHPLAGQGVNLGFLDAATLVETLLAGRAGGEDVGDRAVLARYSRARRVDNLVVAAAMDGLSRLFGARNPAIGLARRTGLGLVGRSLTARRRLMQEALGLSRDLPARLSADAS